MGDTKLKEKSKPKAGSKDHSRLARAIPLEFREASRDARHWKTFARCMIATFAGLVLLVVDSSLHALGQAAFFSLIVSQMLPPSMALSLFLMIATMLVFGMCLGWAWGCAAMASALRARNVVLLQQQIQNVQSSFTSNTNLDAQYQSAIFQGRFLDPGSSAVYGIFLFFGVYGVNFIRAKRPKLTLAAIFAMIVMDIMCSYGPLFPSAVYTLANTLLIPTACFIAIGIASSVLIFPQSIHHIVLSSLIKAGIRPCLKILELQEDVLAGKADEEELRGLRKLHIEGMEGMKGQLPMLNLEINHSRMSSPELTSLYALVEHLGERAVVLGNFQMMLHQRQTGLDRLKEGDLRTAPRVKHMFAERSQRLDSKRALDALQPKVAEATSSLRSTVAETLNECISWLDQLNHTRWRKAKSPLSITSRNKLDQTLKLFRSEGQAPFLEPFREMFNQDGKMISDSRTELAANAPDLFLCFVFTTSLLAFGDTVLEIADRLVEIDHANPTSKFHFPGRVAKNVAKAANDQSSSGNPLDGEGRLDDDRSSERTVVEDEEKGASGSSNQLGSKRLALDPDADDPKHGIQRAGRAISRLWGGLTSPAGLFALKVGLASIALWVPQVVDSSAEFVGLWALIMAQTGMAVYTGEQIGAFFLRMGGTICGLVVGIVAWYIGAGSGTGNPYGIVAITTALLAPFMFWRLAVPQKKSIIPMMTGVTAALIVGYGWVDSHVYQVANSGWGAELAGKRALLVLIGFTAGFIIMLFPRPVTAKHIIRKGIVKNLRAMEYMFGDIVSGTKESEKGAATKRRRQEFASCFERLHILADQIPLASLEPGLKGPWPRQKYDDLLDIQALCIASLGSFAAATSRMDAQWRSAMQRRVDLLHPAFIADCFALLSILHQALNHATLLPPTMPIFERLMYHRRRTRQYNAVQSEKQSASESNLDTENGTDSVPNVQQVEAQLLTQEEVSWQRLQDPQFADYAVASISMIQFVGGLDRLHRVITSLVGEQSFAGFDQSQRDWGESEIAKM